MCPLRSGPSGSGSAIGILLRRTFCRKEKISMYKKVSTDMNFVAREKEVEKFWDENHIFEKSIEEREGCPEYIFYC